MSVFLYERCGEIEKALDLANRAFDEGVANVNETNEESFKNCTMILQLIRDNINLWSEEVDVWFMYIRFGYVLLYSAIK